MSANKRHLKEIIKISNFDNDASRRNQVTLPFSMMYTSSDGDHITFMPVYPGNAEYLHMPSGNTPMHQHDYFELFYIFSGEVCQIFDHGTFRYQKGDALLMNLNIRHCESSSTVFSGVYDTSVFLFQFKRRGKIQTFLSAFFLYPKPFLSGEAGAVPKGCKYSRRDSLLSGGTAS